MLQFMGYQEGRIFSYSGKGQPLCSILAFHSPAWMRPTPIREGNLLYAVYGVKD